MIIYAVNHNPLGKNDKSLSEIKKDAISACMNSLRAERGLQIEPYACHSFSYACADPKCQARYMEYLMEDAVKNEAQAVVFWSLDDIYRGHPKEAVRMMLRWSACFKNLSLFLASYSCQASFAQYSSALLDYVFRTDHYNAMRITMRPKAPKRVMDYAIYLRLNEKIFYKDIEEYTGITVSALHTHITAITAEEERDWKNGRGISDEEIDKIRDLFEEERASVMEQVQIFPDE